MRPRIIGCGNDWRRDDGAGPETARRLRAALPAGADVQQASGEAGDLLERMKGAERVVLIDAMRSGARPGSLVRLEPLREGLDAGAFAGTHGLGPAQALALAPLLGLAPRALVVYGIEGADFSHGVGLTPAVDAAAARLVRLLGGEG